MNSGKGSFCPLIEAKHKKSERRWFYGPCEECTILLLVYNSYRLNVLGQQFVENSDGNK